MISALPEKNLTMQRKIFGKSEVKAKKSHQLKFGFSFSHRTE